jgi:Na+/H+ antiporter NhaD/arsenite permease-like protein
MHQIGQNRRRDGANNPGARLRRYSVPYLSAVAMASNVGSVATITNNPQNIMTGSFSGIPYGALPARWRRWAAIRLVLAFRCLRFFIRANFGRGRLDGAPAPARAYRPLAVKSTAVTAAMMAGFSSASRRPRWRWSRARCCW